MSNIQILKQIYRAAEQGDRQTLNDLLADNFQWVHKGAEPVLDKPTAIDYLVNLHNGLPDLRIHLDDLKEGEPVSGTMRITGTHTGSLRLTPYAERTIDATDKPVQLPPEPSTWSIKNGKMTRQQTEAVPGGGPTGLLDQLGVSIASAR